MTAPDTYGIGNKSIGEGLKFDGDVCSDLQEHSANHRLVRQQLIAQVHMGDVAWTSLERKTPKCREFNPDQSLEYLPLTVLDQ